MGWVEKQTSISFENQPLEGLFFLDGARIGYPPAKNDKYPMLHFPSGMECPLWESSAPDNPTVHLFGEMDLRLKSSRDEAYQNAQFIAEQVGYAVKKVGENQLELWGFDDTEHLMLTYDYQQQILHDVRFIHPKEAQQPRPQPELLDEKTKQSLPKLYSQEKLGLEALAQVKLFLPGTYWTWYGSEASAILDDDSEKALHEVDLNTSDIRFILFFGLVIGDEIELSYFQLAELVELKGAFGLPIERDKFFEPKTLKELRDMHENERKELK
jgi:hypothetical protein